LKTLVIGHKNPDTDSICSALAYAELLRAQGQLDVEAAACGEPNERTMFALSRAGLRPPRIVSDVRLTAGQICERDVVVAEEDEALYETFNRLRERNVGNVPVVDPTRRVQGLLSIQKALDLLLPGSERLPRARIVESSLARIARVLGGTFQNAVDCEREAELFVTVAALSAKRFVARMSGYDSKNLIVVAGDRPTVQEPAIEQGVFALVLTGGSRLIQRRLKQAKARGVNVLVSPHDTATTIFLIQCAKPIRLAMQTTFTAFEELTTIEEVRARLREATWQDLFPVLDETRQLAGVISRTDLVNARAARIILVDHNELSQAVDGAAEADIVEVLDHHRLGGSLVSREPIRFINEPVGSTCTLVARAYRSSELHPSPGIALCMAAGVIADTLHLKSPTATPLDAEMLDWLSRFTDVPIADFAAELFAAGSILQTLPPRRAVEADCKIFEENGWRIGVAQVEELGFDHFGMIKEELRSALGELNQARGLDLSCLLVTDITRQDSLLLAVGGRQLILAIDYPRASGAVDLFELRGVVSRKKQLLPHLIRVLRDSPSG
jgi:manganese-dependent inorganic pyrophosphatase